MELNPNGSLLGEYSAEQDLPAVPMAGFFTYSETKEFDLSYTTTTELPVVGETTFMVTGTGQGNDDNTHITGVWTITVDVSNLVTKTFEGTFALKKLEETDVMGWWMF